MKPTGKALHWLPKWFTLTVILASTAFSEEPLLREATAPTCEDSTKAQVAIDPRLESGFFTETKKSYPWHIVDHEGKLEDTLDGTVDEEDRIQIEHTAHCVSDHQGMHTMDFCDASIGGGTTILTIWGGLPAYASSLTLKIAEDSSVTCSFKASYPAPTQGLSWRITKKTIRMRERNPTEGERLHGWISVEFEERSERDGKIVWTPHKIEGFVKPIVQKAVTRTTASEQGGARQPATAIDSKSEGNEKSKPESERRSQ